MYSLHELVEKDIPSQIPYYYDEQKCAMDVNGFTATMQAAQLNRVRCLKTLRGCELLSQSSQREFRMQHEGSGETALIMACKQRFEEAARTLISEYGIIDKLGYSALAYALMSKNERLVNLLQPCEQNLRIQGLTVLQFVVFCGLQQFFELFKDQIGQFSIPNRTSFKHEVTALTIAALSCRWDFMTQLKEEAGLQDCDGKTALMKVFDLIHKIQAGNHDIEPFCSLQIEDLKKSALILIEFKYEQRKQDNLGETALMRAVKCNNCDDIYQKLIPIEGDLVDAMGMGWKDKM